MKKLFFALAILFAVEGNAQKLTPEEKKILDLIDKQMPQTLQLLEQLVNINSSTLNIAGVKKNGDILRKEFDKIGFNTEWIPMPDSVKRAGHLVAGVRGKKGKKL